MTEADMMLTSLLMPILIGAVIYLFVRGRSGDHPHGTTPGLVGGVITPAEPDRHRRSARRRGRVRAWAMLRASVPNQGPAIRVGTVVVLAIFAAGCGGGDATPATTTPVLPASSIRVVVDTDAAIDDLVALTFLLASDDVDVLAITVSGTGEVRCPAGIGVVQALLARTGDQTLPVACGRASPLQGTHEFPLEWRDAADSGWGVLVPPEVPDQGTRSAVELLGETLEPDVALLTLGPLTNIADAFRYDAELADRVASIVVMGGAVDVTGNVVDPDLNAVDSEWNVYVDPTAASEVFSSGAPVLLVALDATNRVPVTPVFLERLALNSHTPAASLVAELYQANPLVGSGDAFFWDPLAAAAVIDPSLLTIERADIMVVNVDGPDIGRTIRSDDGDPIDVATSADAAVFEDLLLRTLDDVQPDEALVELPPAVGEAVVVYDGTDCTYDGPTTVKAGRMGFTFETDDSAWVAAVAHLTGEFTIEEILAWVQANPDVQEAPPGIDEVIVVPPGTTTYVTVAAPGVGVVCSPYEPGPLLIAASLTVE
jgi:pyrimidine-specific ribonucleoside hydrolase